jgi:hypothetical protein
MHIFRRVQPATATQKLKMVRSMNGAGRESTIAPPTPTRPHILGGARNPDVEKRFINDNERSAEPGFAKQRLPRMPTTTCAGGRVTRQGRSSCHHCRQHGGLDHQWSGCRPRMNAEVCVPLMCDRSRQQGATRGHQAWIATATKPAVYHQRGAVYFGMCSEVLL